MPPPPPPPPAPPPRFWKRLWRQTTFCTLNEDSVLSLISQADVKDQLKIGLATYKPLASDGYAELQKKYPEQTKLLSVAQTLQSLLDLNTFQTWDMIMHYLCDESYGTPENALKNIACLDARLSHLLPKIWNFYHFERLFLLKLIKYILEFKDDKSHKYHHQFTKVISDIGIQELKTSLLSQFLNVVKATPPTRRMHTDLGEAYFKQQWAHFNLCEQLEILQILLLIVDEVSMSAEEFVTMFEHFKKHDFGKKQMFNELLEERHKELCLKIMFNEIMLFLVAADEAKIKSGPSTWIESTKDVIESELTKLQQNEENSPMLLAWMLLTLHSDQHSSYFEGHYQHFGITAFRLHVFKFLHLMITNPIYVDNSKSAHIARMRIFQLVNDTCDKFDGDGSVSHQPHVMELCGELLKDEHIAHKFWMLFNNEDRCGAVSLWNTALEYFPHNFSALSILAAGLAQAGKSSAKMIITELKTLPVFTEIYRPNSIPVAKKSLDSDEVIVRNDYYPLFNSTYKVGAGSDAAIMERKEGTFIHFRTPICYWTVLIYEIEKVLDRKAHNQAETESILSKIWEGAKVLKAILKVCSDDNELPKSVIAPSEAVFEILVRFMRLEIPPLPLLVSCLESCTALVRLFPKEIHSRLINTGLLPRLTNYTLSHTEYANGACFDSGTVGQYLINLEQPNGNYMFLNAYIDMLGAFWEYTRNEKIIMEIFLPGLILILREVFPNICSWRYGSTAEKRRLTEKCVALLSKAVESTRIDPTAAEILVQNTCVYSLLHKENAVELLKIVSVGDNQLQQMMCDETNWVSGPGIEYLKTMQRSLTVLIQILRVKHLVTDTNKFTPIEHLIFAQTKQQDCLKVIPKVTTYINHAFVKSLPDLTCRLLNRFAAEFQMSLFACLDMTAYQVRVIFLDRLRDEYEYDQLKTAILEFVTTCVGKQPGLTEAFFKMQHVKEKEEGKKDDRSSGVLTYMADYLGSVKSDASKLHSPVLGCVMALFHALWKNNMQVLIRDLTEMPTFWEHMTSPLFTEIQPGLKAYAQTFNVLGIELFVRRDKIDPNLKETLERFFNTDNKHLDKWIDYIFSFHGRHTEIEGPLHTPTWLGLLTSWKDFTTILCKCLPIPLNICHKSKMVSPCMTALLSEIKDLTDSRLIVILSELYVIMLANWKDDCFDNRKANVKQIDELLNHTGIVYESLHPRAKRAILSIGTVAISTLDYEIKANATIAQSIIRSVTNINSLELDKLYSEMREQKIQNTEHKLNGHVNEDIAPVVLSLAMLEQCLELYDDMFSSLSQWFQSTRFVNKLLCCLNTCLQNRKHYNTSLAALRCLTAYARGPFSKDLLLSDVDQFLWLPLIPPKAKISAEPTINGPDIWKPEEWWRVYAYSLDFISMMVMKHGQFFASDAIMFAGVHLEYLVEAVLLPRQYIDMEAINLCASALNLVVQLVKFEARWRMENINSLSAMMRSISVCLYHCVTLAIRSRVLHQLVERPNSSAEEQPGTPSQKVTKTLNRILEIIHMSTLCLLSFSPDLLSLLANPYLDIEKWQPLVELHFGAPKISYEPFPQLTFGTLLSAVALLTKSLNHTYHADDASSPSRSPKSHSVRRRHCSCSSPSEGTPKRVMRSESVTSMSSTTSAVTTGWLAAFDKCLVANTLESVLTLLASQALLTTRDPSVASRDKQLVKRELCSELIIFHDFIRKRILNFSHSKNNLVRNKLGIWPLSRNEEEAKQVAEARKSRSGEGDDEMDTEDQQLPPPPPPKRPSQDSMREFILRKQYLDKAKSVQITSTPTKISPTGEGFSPSPVSHSTPAASDKKSKDKSKRVSWAETTRDSDADDSEPIATLETVYSTLTDVQINNDEDYFHFMSIVLLYICQTEL